MRAWASLFSALLRSPEPEVVMGALEVRFSMTIWRADLTGKGNSRI